MITIHKHAIPFSEISSGDSFRVDLHIGYFFLDIEVIDNIPYIVFLEDDEKPLINTYFIVTDSSQQFTEILPYIGSFSVTPGEKFYIFEGSNVD